LSRPMRRAKFRLNAANRSEAFCSLEGLPSDMTIRGDINHNRCVHSCNACTMPAHQHAQHNGVRACNSAYLRLVLLPATGDHQQQRSC
jgi:hypothetical protein